MANYIRFDWAMKRLLRNKANYAVLEGFMCSLLNEKFKINRFLDSESNQQTENDKFNRVDILAENEKGEFIIFEIQNTREHTYSTVCSMEFPRSSQTISVWAMITTRCARYIPSISCISHWDRLRIMYIMARRCSRDCISRMIF